MTSSRSWTSPRPRPRPNPEFSPLPGLEMGLEEFRDVRGGVTERDWEFEYDTGVDKEYFSEPFGGERDWTENVLILLPSADYE